MSIEPWIDVELKHGLSKQTDPWGRRVIQAIDMDDCIAMFEVFDDRNNNKSSGPKNINSQVTLFGYGEYIWTSYVHRYIGDTALHLAIKQKKMMCLHMLLILKANPTIVNASFVSAEDLCKQFLGTSALNLAYESMKYILNNLNPKQFKRMPDSALYRSLQNEAWMLLREGRIMYSELPASLNTANLEVISATEKKSYLSFNVPPPSSADDGGSVGTIDSNEMLLMEVGPVRRWVKMTDATTGMEYFFDELSGESSWEVPVDWEATPSTSAPAPPGAVTSSLASAEYHSYLDGANDEGDDDRAEIEALKIRIRHMEKIDKQRHRLSLLQKGNAQVEAKRRAEEAARLQAIQALKAMMAQRILMNKERMKRRAEEERLGASNSPGANATGDVWSRGTIVDVISLITRQKKRRMQLTASSDQFVAKGLGLLGSVKMRSAVERVGVQDGRLQAGDKAALQNIPPEMHQLEGLKKLRFLKMGQLSALTKTLTAPATIPISTHAESINVSSASQRIVSSVPTKLLTQSQMSVDRSFVYDPAAHMSTVDYNASREITTISTASNLKYMKVGDRGLQDLSRALQGDMVITALNLSNARVSSVSVEQLAAVLPSMSALVYLDLSCNLICDEGASALSTALSDPTSRIDKVVLTGNRIRLRGAISLVQTVLASGVSWISLKSNLLSGEDQQLMVKLLDEHDYVSRDEAALLDGRGDGRVKASPFVSKGRNFRLAERMFVRRPSRHFAQDMRVTSGQSRRHRGGDGEGDSKSDESDEEKSESESDSDDEGERSKNIVL